MKKTEEKRQTEGRNSVASTSEEKDYFPKTQNIRDATTPSGWPEEDDGVRLAAGREAKGTTRKGEPWGGLGGGGGRRVCQR